MSEMPQKPAVAEVRNYDKVSYKFVDSYFEGKSDGPKELDLKGGIISEINLPAGWTEVYSRRRLVGADTHVPGIMFDIEITGIPVGNKHLSQFKHMLKAPPHELNDNEKKWLQDMLDNQDSMAAPILSAQTYDVDHRRVLETRASYIKENDERYSQILDLYVDINVPHLGHYLQKITYWGSPKPFDEHLNEARQIFHSIKWLTEYDFSD
jgi:hypothetical protein